MSKFHKAMAHYRIVAMSDSTIAGGMEDAMKVANPMPTLPPASGLSAVESTQAMRKYKSDLLQWQERDSLRRSIAKIQPNPKRI
jgi:hypothetical protein